MNEKINKTVSVVLAGCVIANTVIFSHKETPHIHPEPYCYMLVNPSYTIVNTSSTENLYGLNIHAL